VRTRTCLLGLFAVYGHSTLSCMLVLGVHPTCRLRAKHAIATWVVARALLGRPQHRDIREQLRTREVVVYNLQQLGP
jgi:hypothetical protein